VGGLSVAAAQPESGSRGGTQATGFGIGAETMLPDTYGIGGLGGLTVVYDAGLFHVEGILGFVDYPDNADGTDLDVGGRFLYHIHEAASADFSIGGGVGMHHVFLDNNRNDVNDFILEGLIQMRAFIVPNVALSGSAGVTATAGDDDLFAVTSQLLGAVGITYYFY